MMPPRRPSQPGQPAAPPRPQPAQRPAPAAPMGGPISQGAPMRRPAPVAPVQQRMPPAGTSHNPRQLPQNPQASQRLAAALGVQQRPVQSAPMQQRPVQQPRPAPAPVQQQAVAPQPQYQRPAPPAIDQSGWAPIGPGVRGRVNQHGELLLVLSPSQTPEESKNGKSEILASTGGGWVRLDNLLGVGTAINLALTRRRGRGARG